MNPTYLLLMYIAMIIGSFVVEVVVKRIHFLLTRTHYKERHFTLGGYAFSLIFPLIVLFIIYGHLGSSIFYIFITSALLGTLLEWIAGWWFHGVMGVRLWTYHRYTIKRYTSFLSIPLWGMAGVFLSLIVRLFTM